MSLINNYLKKTRLESEGKVPETDVPPLLKSGRRKKTSSGLRLLSVAVLGFVVAGGTAIYFQTNALENSGIVAQVDTGQNTAQSTPLQNDQNAMEQVAATQSSAPPVPEAKQEAVQEPAAEPVQTAMLQAREPVLSQETAQQNINAQADPEHVSQPASSDSGPSLSARDTSTASNLTPSREQIKDESGINVEPEKTETGSEVSSQIAATPRSEPEVTDSAKPEPIPEVRIAAQQETVSEPAGQDIKPQALVSARTSTPEPQAAAREPEPVPQPVSEPVRPEPQKQVQDTPEPESVQTAQAGTNSQSQQSSSEPRQVAQLQEKTAPAPPEQKRRLVRQINVQENIPDKPGETRISNIAMPMPHDSEINNYFQIALVAQRQRDFDQAEKFYNRVLEMRPGHLESMTNLSVIYMELDQEFKARKMIQDILQINPDDARAYVNLGVMDLSRNDFESARENFSKALEKNPREQTALTNMAYIAKRQGDFDQVERYYERILNIQPKNMNILLTFAGAMEQKKDLQKAQDLYIQALEIAEESRNNDMIRQIRERISMINYYMN